MQYVQLELDQLLAGQAFTKGSTTFPTTRQLVEPFLNQVKDYVEDWKITAKIPSEIAVTTREEHGIEKSESHLIYPRVAIEGILKPEYQLQVGGEPHNKTVGMIYGLDTKAPVAKVYTGYLRELCMNLTVFSPDNLQSVNLDDPHFERLYSFLPAFIQESAEHAQKYHEIYTEMNEHLYGGTDLLNLLGLLALKSAKENLLGAYTTMVSFIQSKGPRGGLDNHYYKSSGEYTKWELYNMLNASLSRMDNGSAFARPRKVLQAYKLMSA